MNEHPILFSSEMVKAICSSHKTQTRRIIKHQPEFGAYISLEGFDRICVVHEDAFGEGVSVQACPQVKKIGDRLWVRESLRLGDDNVWRYSADDSIVYCGAEGIAWAHHKESNHCSSIHMPRWASRISLKVVNVRAERLKQISEEDAKSEGVTASGGWNADESEYCVGYRTAFSRLWDAINGGGAWALNPWVWVIEFQPLTCSQ